MDVKDDYILQSRRLILEVLLRRLRENPKWQEHLLPLVEFAQEIGVLDDLPQLEDGIS